MILLLVKQNAIETDIIMFYLLPNSAALNFNQKSECFSPKLSTPLIYMNAILFLVTEVLQFYFCL